MFAAASLDLKRFIRDIPDFPKPGILFRDITPLLADPAAFREAIRQLAEPFRGQKIDAIVAAEARGFIFAAPLAIELGTGFVPVRKPGKLPWERVREEYTLEYGVDALEAHRDGVAAGHRVLIVDDVLATGGTAKAAGTLARGLGADLVGWTFLLEIGALGGRGRLADARCQSLVVV